jgi:predicted dinucleotide-binding enzyme
MNMGIIGSGIVGQTVGGKLVALGHDVVLGTRDPSDLHSAKGMAGALADWLAGAGTISVEALTLAGAENLAGKEGDWLYLAMERRDSGAVIGDVSLHCLSAEHKQGEIGFVLHPDHHG